jgi:hypothetical protein
MKIYIALLIAIFSTSIFAYINGTEIGEGYSNDPPHRRSCFTGDCHSGSTSGEATIDGLPEWGYVPGQTYDLTLTVDHSSARRWGFQMIVKDADNNVSGELSSIDAFTVRDGRYLTMTRNGNFRNQTGPVSWNFRWTAPSSDIGPVTFYSALAACNNDGHERDDSEINIERTVSFTNSVDENIEPHSEIDAICDIYDINGKFIARNLINVASSELSTGLYLAYDHSNREIRKFVVVR